LNLNKKGGVKKNDHIHADLSLFVFLQFISAIS